MVYCGEKLSDANNVEWYLFNAALVELLLYSSGITLDFVLDFLSDHCLWIASWGRPNSSPMLLHLRRHMIKNEELTFQLEHGISFHLPAEVLFA
jgi:hypothetical protein